MKLEYESRHSIRLHMNFQKIFNSKNWTKFESGLQTEILIYGSDLINILLKLLNVKYY